MPAGGAAQFIARPVVTAGFAGDLPRARRLVPDTIFTKSVGDLSATVSFDPEPFVAGLYGHLKFLLADRAAAGPSPTCKPISALSATR